LSAVRAAPVGRLIAEAVLIGYGCWIQEEGKVGPSSDEA